MAKRIASLFLIVAAALSVTACWDECVGAGTCADFKTCCSSYDCYYVADGETFYCDGLDCYDAAYDLNYYCSY